MDNSEVVYLIVVRMDGFGGEVVLRVFKEEEKAQSVLDDMDKLDCLVYEVREIDLE